MHLERPGLSTTSTKKRKERITKARQQELESGWKERNVFLRSINLPKETFEQYQDWIYGRGKKNTTKTKSKTKPAPANAAVYTGKQILVVDKEPSRFSTSAIQTNEGEVFVSSLSSWVTGPVASKPSPTYTGTKILGIGTMHKSNMVPIFNSTEAEDISKMRR